MKVADHWFARERVDDRITRLWEPHVARVFQCNIWHVRGRDRDLLIDAGMGLSSLKRAIASLIDGRRSVAAIVAELKARYPEVAELGVNLSLGQRQLVSFARAIVSEPRILILDEATASVDSETELKIQRALGVVLQGRTAIVIAHRLSTIKNADKIVVLEEGQAVQVGSHDELIDQDGLYRELYD